MFFKVIYEIFSSPLGLDFLLPDGDEYKLVFISSDSSSKEEDLDDNDSSSTASRLVKHLILRLSIRTTTY